VQLADHVLHLPAHVDVLQGRRVALVLHELLEDWPRQVTRVLRGEGPAEVMEPVQMTGVRVDVVLIVGKVDTYRMLDLGEREVRSADCFRLRQP
jgi:hypothetical protein